MFVTKKGGYAIKASRLTRELGWKPVEAAESGYSYRYVYIEVHKNPGFNLINSAVICKKGT